MGGKTGAIWCCLRCRPQKLWLIAQETIALSSEATLSHCFCFEVTRIGALFWLHLHKLSTDLQYDGGPDPDAASGRVSRKIFHLIFKFNPNSTRLEKSLAKLFGNGRQSWRLAQPRQRTVGRKKQKQNYSKPRQKHKRTAGDARKSKQG